MVIPWLFPILEQQLKTIPRKDNYLSILGQGQRLKMLMVSHELMLDGENLQQQYKIYMLREELIFPQHLL